MGTECIFNRGLDRRSKYAQRHAEQEVISLHQLLDNLVDAFDAGNIAQLGKLLSCVRESRWSQMGSQDRVYSNEEQSGQNETGTDFRKVIAV